MQAKVMQTKTTQVKVPVSTKKEFTGNILVNFTPNGDTACVGCLKRQNSNCPLACLIVYEALIKRINGGEKV